MTRRTILFCSLLLLLSLSPALAQKRAFTIEDLYRVKNISDLHLSPDGKTLIFVVTTSDLARARRSSHVWAMDTDGRNMRQWTVSDKSEYSPTFSPDGRQLLFISAKDGGPNLYLMNTGGGEWRRLTNISTGVADPLWSPDGKWVAFSTDVYPECGGDDACNRRIAERWESGPLKAHMADELLFRHWNAWKDGTRTHTFVVNVQTGETRDLTPGDFDSPTFQLGGPIQYDFSPDGKEFVYVSNHDKVAATSTNNDLWLISLSDREPQPKNITGANPAYDGSPKYSPDGRYIAYRTQKQPAYESDLFRIALYDRSTGKSRVMTESFRNWVDDFQWSKDSRHIYFTGPVEGKNPVFQLDVASGAITPVLEDKTIDAFEMAEGGRRVIYVRRSVGEPNEVYSAEVAAARDSAPRKLTTLNDALMSEVDVRPAESMWVTASGGAKIHVFIVKPHGFDPSRKYPLILNVHGGPQSQWADAFRGDWQVYPGAGYVVAFANPHGSTGYGQDFTAQISGDMGGRVFDDLMKVTDALEKLPYVDRNRMGAMGWSYGGYMMNWFQGHTTRFKALASMMGVFDWWALYGSTEELWWPEWDMKGTPWTNPQGFDKWSPSSYIKNFKTPTLIITGERDYRIPYTQSLQYFTTLRRLNIPARLLVYSNAGHWPSWYEMALYYTAHLEWFNKYLGGGPAPWSSEQFLRNAVFDRATGQRLPDETTSRTTMAKPAGTENQPKDTQGKPDAKPKTP